MSTIYSALGLTARHLEPLKPAGPTRSAVGYTEQPDGDPIVGLHYACDFRAEEEYGTSELRDAITSSDPRRYVMTKAARRHVALFSDVNGFVLSTRILDNQEPKWGDHLTKLYATSDREPEYAAWFRSAISASSKLLGSFPRQTVKELREIAKSIGVTPLPSKRADLISAIQAVELKDPSHAPTEWPAWFHYGRELVLRADSGPVAIVIERLRAAAQNGTLAIGNGSQAFGSGLFLYDAADETPGLVKQREAAHDWYDARMAELAPVKKDLEANVLGFYALGNPTVLDSGDGAGKQVRYWMNSHSTSLAYDKRQIFGWFTLEQLKDRSFVDIYNRKRKASA